MITIENPSGTSLMRMTATNSDAQLAADIANAAADAVAERISEVMVIDKPSSVEEAEKPNYPVSPNVKKNMIMGWTDRSSSCSGSIYAIILTG